jgi:hypothetical protein
MQILPCECHMWVIKTTYITTRKRNLTRSVLPVGLLGSNPTSLN